MARNKINNKRSKGKKSKKALEKLKRISAERRNATLAKVTKKNTFRRAGVTRIQGGTLDEIDNIVDNELLNIIRGAMYNAIPDNRRTIQRKDVEVALKARGIEIF